MKRNIAMSNEIKLGKWHLSWISGKPSWRWVAVEEDTLLDVLEIKLFLKGSPPQAFLL